MFELFEQNRTTTEQIVITLNKPRRCSHIENVTARILDEYNLVCAVKEMFLEMPAWTEHIDKITKIIGHDSMADFYHYVGAIVYWTNIAVKKEAPGFDPLDCKEVEETLKEAMDELAMDTDYFMKINLNDIKYWAEVSKEIALKAGG